MYNLYQSARTKDLERRILEITDYILCQDIQSIKIHLPEFESNYNEFYRYGIPLLENCKNHSPYNLFLNMAIELGNIHLLETIWDYGIERYLEKKTNQPCENFSGVESWELTYWMDIMDILEELIVSGKHIDILKLLISKIQQHKDKVTNWHFIHIYEEVNPLTGLSRESLRGNLLSLAIYHNRIDLIDMLLAIQPDYNFYIKKTEEANNKLNSTLAASLVVKYRGTFYDSLEFYEQYYYTFDKGNVEILDYLLNKNFKIDFSSTRFAYELSDYAHKDIIDYFFREYKNQMKLVDMNVVMDSANYYLLRLLLMNGSVITAEHFKWLYHQHLLKINKYKNPEIRKENLLRCLHVFSEQNITLDTNTQPSWCVLKSKES